jgi:hypothetical protein
MMFPAPVLEIPVANVDKAAGYYVNMLGFTFDWGDELFAQWKAAQAKIASEPEDKPWMLREFMATDLDGNLIRVFYYFRGDL